MTFAIDKWKKNVWKIALWSAFGLLAIKFAIWPLLQGTYDKVRSVGKKEIGIVEWLPNLGPYWLVALGAVVLFLLLIYAGAKDGKTASERLQKAIKIGFAFAGLAALLAFTAFLGIFIVGPRYFWGEPSVIQVQQQPAAQVRASEFPKEFRVSALPGNPQDPNAPWSAPIRFAGRRGSFQLAGDSAPIAVKTEVGIHIITVGMPHLGTPERLQFLSLTNRSLEITGRVE
ncbi:MAG: hypothetical protein G01um101417_65 [Parcubacteria group bacterium Gr01-1014_17]|nr:MAG: hypothetical protein G01um101417_65 [Parcubacteria group bacterium Gr01-1014_17]